MKAIISILTILIFNSAYTQVLMDWKNIEKKQDTTKMKAYKGHYLDYLINKYDDTLFVTNAKIKNANDYFCQINKKKYQPILLELKKITVLNKEYFIGSIDSIGVVLYTKTIKNGEEVYKATFKSGTSGGNYSALKNHGTGGTYTSFDIYETNLYKIKKRDLEYPERLYNNDSTNFFFNPPQLIKIPKN